MSLPPFQRTLEEWPRFGNATATNKSLTQQKTSCRQIEMTVRKRALQPLDPSAQKPFAPRSGGTQTVFRRL